jgi:hypothetical protein
MEFCLAALCPWTLGRDSQMPKLHRFGILAAALISITFPAIARHYGRVVLMGKWVLVFDDRRILFHAGMMSGDFFDQLERRETSDGQRFFLHTGSITNGVTSYPQSIVVKAFGSRWDLGETPFDKRCMGTAAAFMESLQFKAEWKTGLETRLVSKMSVRRLETKEMAPTALWGYELDIDADGVPLSDHLIVTAFGQDSSNIVRFSGEP